MNNVTYATKLINKKAYNNEINISEDIVMVSTCNGLQKVISVRKSPCTEQPVVTLEDGGMLLLCQLQQHEVLFIADALNK